MCINANSRLPSPPLLKGKSALQATRSAQLDNRIKNLNALILKTEQNHRLSRSEKQGRLTRQKATLKMAYSDYKVESDIVTSSEDDFESSLLGRAILHVLTVAAMPVTMAMNFAEKHPFIAAGVVLGSTIMGAIAGPIHEGSTFNAHRENNTNQDAEKTNATIVTPITQNSTHVAEQEEIYALPFDQNAIALAYRHLNSTDTADETVLTSMSFLSAECEERVLNDIFNGTIPASTAAPDIDAEASTSPSSRSLPKTQTGTQNTIDSKTVWHSNVTGIHQRQMNFTLRDLEAATGRAITDNGKCILNMSLDPDMLPNGRAQPPESTSPTATGSPSGQAQTTARPSHLVTQCSTISTSTLTGLNANGEPVLSAALDVCHDVELNDAATPSTSTAPPETVIPKESKVNYTAQAQNETHSPLLNSSLAQQMSEESIQDLMDTISDIRADYCPQELTIMGDHSLPNNGTLTQAQTLMQELVRDIGRLCPNATIRPIDSSNITQTLGAVGIVQLLGDFAMHPDFEHMVIVQADEHVQSTEDGLAFPLSELAEGLRSKNIPVFSYNPNSWTGAAADLGYLESVDSVAELMARLSPAVNGAVRERRAADLPPTTEMPSTVPSTTEVPPTTKAPSTTVSVAESSPTISYSTEEPSAATSVNEALPTLSSSTEEASTAIFASEATSTRRSTTEIPSTARSTTKAPTTASSSTEIPSTQGSTTKAPPTASSSTEIPSTPRSESEAPSTTQSTTEVPSEGTTRQASLPSATTNEIATRATIAPAENRSVIGICVAGSLLLLTVLGLFLGAKKTDPSRAEKSKRKVIPNFPTASDTASTSTQSSSLSFKPHNTDQNSETESESESELWESRPFLTFASNEETASASNEAKSDNTVYERMAKALAKAVVNDPEQREHLPEDVVLEEIKTNWGSTANFDDLKKEEAKQRAAALMDPLLTP